MLRCGVYSTDEIQNNLSFIRAISFSNDKWEEYCQLNREAFIKKLNASLEQQKRLKRM